MHQVCFVINLLRVIFVFSVDVDDLKICYILKHKNNATSDTFIFYIEDSGKFAKYSFFLSFTGKLSFYIIR